MNDIGRRRGRPKKSEFAQEYSDNNINSSNNTFDEDADLKEHLKNKKIMNNNPVVDNIDEAVLKEIQNIDEVDEAQIVDDYNPLEDAVQDRGYTKGIIQNETVSERIIDEPIYTSANAVKPDVDEKLLNPNNIHHQAQQQQEQKQKNTAQPQQPQPQFSDNQSQTSSGSSSSNSSQATETNEKQLTPKEKRDAAEKTAEIILLAYKNYLPLPFIYFGKINIKKLKESEQKGEIDLQAPIDRRGTRFIDRVEKFNKDVEASFDVSDEEVEAIREPLVDVLMEKEVSLTPTQRLMLVVSQSIVGKVINVAKIISEQKSMISEFKEMHRERMESDRLTREAVKNKNVKKPIIVDDEEEEEKFIKNNKETYSDNVRKSASDDIKKTETVNYTEVPNIDDVLNSSNDDDELNDVIEENNDDDDDNDIPD